MKRRIVIGTLMVFIWMSLFFLLSCAKKQLITEEKAVKKPPEPVKMVEKEKPAVKVEEDEEAKKAEKIRLERLKELERIKDQEAKSKKYLSERQMLHFESRAIFFDFDKSFIRPEYIPVLKEKAEYLKNNPNINIRIEGNCDERGTNEYNLALGERRANSAKKLLISLGISPDRIDTISYGEERPLALGHNREAWAQNRRDDFVIIK